MFVVVGNWGGPTGFIPDILLLIVGREYSCGLLKTVTIEAMA